MAEVVEVLLRAKMEASGVETGVNQIKNSLKGLSLPKGISDDLEKSFSKLTPLLKDYQKQLNKGFSNKKDLQNFNTLKEKINEVFSDIEGQVQKVNSEEIRLKVDTQEIDRLEKQIASKMASLQKTLDSVVTKNFNFDSITKKFEEKTKGISSATVTAMWGKASDAFQAQDYIKYNQIIDETRNKILSFSKIRFDFAKSLGFDGKKTDIEDITRAIDDFFNSIKVNSGQVERISRTKEEIEKLKNTAKDLKFNSLSTGKTTLEGLKGTLDNLISGFKRTGSAATEAGNGVVRMSEEVNQLKTSTQYFFSLRNMINLFKRGVQEAVQTVKELDAAMTETAVVTKYSVADMWGKLPEYTAMANKLGGTIKGAYETTTLYYQQGLDTDAAMGIGEETIKMARIAGLDYAETTDMMTAALRGFNMELNNLSAQHINDVYSQLAAKTASNTQEIGSAMERTASIAHSAGMSFEGTSAFLAQMIETTREAPENLGTAMKTIIARFQELKKDPMDMEEVDGELPDYNKVDTALKSIGVDLKNQRGEFRALDEVFIDIAKRWDSLDQRQQRYVATTAAGSRQQSRFIAMMNNYERTAELMEYANDSAGASQEQFNKTLDSFEAKANKLKNAWDQFLMGITDNKIIKGGLDLLTGIITTINKLIDTVSGGFGPLKSFLSLFTAFTGLKVGGGLINRLIGGLGGMLDPRSSFKKGFGVGATGFNSAQAAQFSNPIVAELEKIYGAITKTNTTSNDKITGKDYFKNYWNANKQFRAISKNEPTSVNKVADIFNTVDDNQGRLIFNNSRGTVGQLKRTFNTIFKKANLDDQMVNTGNELVKEMFKGVKSGEISAKEMASALVDPTKLGKIIGTDSAKEISNQLRKNLFGNKSNHFYKQALENLGKSNLTGKELKQYLKTNNAEVQAEVQKLKEQHIANQLSENGQVLIKQATLSEKAANMVGRLGSAFSTTGQAASAFGMILSNMGLESAGAAFMSLGNTISSVGMAINGVSGMISSFGIGPALAALAAIAIPVTIIAKAKIDESNIKEEAEKITKTYQDTIDRTTEKISGLEANKDILNNLSSGVDEFGNNISLTNEEYEQFVTASREVANLSPSLIKGYNAQGDAIIATGRALDERIAKEKELQEIAKQNYVSTSSLETLADAARVSDEFKKYSDRSFENQIANPQYAQSFIMPAYVKSNYSATSLAAEYLGQDSDFIDGIVKSSTNFSYMTKEVDDLNQALKEAREAGVDVDKIFEELTGNKIDWENIGLTDIENITNHSADIIDRINEEYRTKMIEASKDINEDFETNLQEAFTPISEGYADLLSGAQTTIDALRQYLTSQHLDAEGLQLSEELVYGFNEGFNNVVIQGIADHLNGSELQQVSRDYAKEWDKLAGAASPYAQVLEDISEAKDEFDKHVGEDGAVDRYNDSIETSIHSLEIFKNSIDTSTTAGQQMVAVLDETIASAQGYASTVEYSLSNALNTLADEFEHAKTAKEEFDKAIEGGDYYTAAQGFKGIYDTITSDENALGYGSNTFWAGAEQMLGTDTLEEYGYDIDKVRAKIKQLGPVLEDGAEGFNNFVDFINEYEGTDKLKEFVNFDPNSDSFEWAVDAKDNLDELADILNIDVDLLSAMLDKSRQYSKINFGDYDKVRGALEQDERVMQGSGKEKTLYVKDTVINQEMENAGVSRQERSDTRKKIEAEGVTILSTEDLTDEKKGIKTTNDLLRDIGLDSTSSLNDTVKAFSKMDFTLEETKQILGRDGIKVEGAGKGKEADIETAWAENAYSVENPTVAEINTYTAGILDNTNAMLIAMGVMSDSIQDQVDSATSEETINGIKKSLVNEDGTFKQFESGTEYDKAKESVKTKIDEYDQLLKELEAGKSNATDEYTRALYTEAIEKVDLSKQELENIYDLAEKQWTEKNNKIIEALNKSGVDYSSLGSNTVDQNYLDQNQGQIVDLMSGGLTEGLNQLKELKETGELSEQTIQNLGLALIKLNPNAFRNLTVEEKESYKELLNLEQSSGKLRSTLSQPFSLKVYSPDSQHLLNYINEIDDKLGPDGVAYREIIFQESFGDEGEAGRVKAFLDQINEEFHGNNASKVLLIEAAVQKAAGNDEEAEKLLTTAYGGKKQAQEASQRLDILCEGHIADAETFKSGIQTEISELMEGGFVSETYEIPLLTEIQNQTTSIPVEINTDEAYTQYKEAETEFKKPIAFPLKVGDNEAKPVVDEVHRLAREAESFTIDADYIGPKEIVVTKKIDTVNSGASKAEMHKGINNTIPVHKSISFNSFAKGYNGPGRKGSKITALTGEKGFEVAWIPSENRSTILGANGPEMATFPADTVIYDHEQSKKILKGNQNKLNLGSFYGGKNGKDYIGDGNVISGQMVKVDTVNVFTGEDTAKDSDKDDKKTKTSEGNKTKDNNPKGTSYNNWSIQEVVRFNLENKIDNYETKFSKLDKQLENMLKKIGTTTKDINGSYKKQVKYLEKIRGYNLDVASSYREDLNKLANGSYKTKISYTPSGGTESKETTVDLSKFITKNYKISRKAIQANTSDPAKQEAIFEAAESALNPLLSGLKSAKEAATKAKEDLKALQTSVYEAFYGWENELTKVYNLSQKIDAYTSKIARFDSQVNLELAKLGAGYSNTSKAINNTLKTLNRSNASIREQLKLQRDMITARKQEMQLNLSAKDEIAQRDKIKKKYGKDSEQYKLANQKVKAVRRAQKYSSVSYNKDGSAILSIDWKQIAKDKLNGRLTDETYKPMKDELDRMQESVVAYNDSIKDQTDYIAGLYEQFENYRETIADFEDTMLQQLEENLKKQIENSKKLNDSLKNTLKDILDEVKEKLQERRQAEDNAKTEKDISQKQQRLNMLRANTAGGNQVEIAQLQKEINEAQQSYGRTLEDQLLDKLQKQGDVAARQRERQISLAETQVELQREDLKAKVYKWLKNPKAYKDQMKELWLAANNYDEKGIYGQKLLEDQFEKAYTELLTAENETEFKHSTNGQTLKDILDDWSGKQVTELNTGKTTSNKTKEKANKTTNLGDKAKAKVNKSIKIGDKAKEKVNKSIKSTSKKELKTYAQHGGSLPSKYPGSFTSSYTTSIQKFLKAIGLYKDSADGSYGPNTRAATKAFQRKVGLTPDGSFGPDTLKKAKVYKYKKGGLADYTGPAWLDGTPSKPEIILDAADTKNFVQLKDILASIMRGNTFNTPVVAAGDTNIEVNINVDHIANDYDVDKLAKRIKRDIVKDSSYRNVTSAKKIR